MYEYWNKYKYHTYMLAYVCMMYACRYLTAHRREPNERKTFTLKRQGPVPFIPTVKLQRCVTDSSLSPCSFTSMLMCVAVCCSVVQCDAACCGETPTVCNGQLPPFLHTHMYVTVCCSVVQCGAVCCRVLQCGAVCCSMMQVKVQWCETDGSLSSYSFTYLTQCVAVYCSVLQCGAVCCSVL